MKKITNRDLIRTVSARWFKVYGDTMDSTPPLFTFNSKVVSERKTKRQISSELQSLDGDTATKEDVALIIGNDSWVRLTCDECEEDVDTVIRVGEKPDYESSTAYLCGSCVLKAFNLL